MKNIPKNNRLVLFLLLIFLISVVVTLSNLGWDKSFIGDDYGINYHFPDKTIKFYYYTWDRFYAPGKLAVTGILGFLWGNFIFVLFKLGFNAIFIERLVYSLFFSISGLGSFFLLNVLLRKYSNITNKNAIYLGAFTGSLLYMFNHFTMYIMSFPLGPYHLSYVLLPLVLALFIYNLQIKTSFCSILIFLITFLFLLNGNPSNTFSIGFFLLAYFLTFIHQIKRSPTNPVFFFTVFLLLVLLLCSYIYLPIIGVKSGLYKSFFTQNLKVSFGFNSIRTSFLNLFRLAGLNVWPNYPYYHLYTSNGFFIFLGYLIPIFAIASLFIRDGEKIKIFFGLVSIIALFFAKGVHPPFPKLFLFISSKIHYFGMYRAVYHKFVFYIVLAYSILIGFFVSQFFCLLKKYYGKARYIVLLVPLMILLYNKPFFTQSVVKRDYLTVIPEEYKKLEDVMKEDLTDFKILSLPSAFGGRKLLLKWNDNLYNGAHPDKFFLNNSVLDSYWFIAYRLIPGTCWGDIKFESNINSVFNYTRILNIKYIFLHKDFVDRYDFKIGGGLKILNGKLRAKIIESILRQQTGVKLIKDSKYYALYKLSNFYFLPHIYPSAFTTAVYGNSSLTQTLPTITRLFQWIKDAQLGLTQTLPTITFRKINPTRYEVKVENAASPFFLVFSESYHPKWKAYVKTENENWETRSGKRETGDEKWEIIAEYPKVHVKEAKHEMTFTPEDVVYLFKKPLPEKYHLLVNGYANAWFIDPNEIGKQNFTITLYFWPQSLFYLGLFISGVTLLGCLGYLGYERIKG